MKTMKIKPNLKQITKYSEEEKYALFVEGKNKVPSPVKNKKAYIREKIHLLRLIFIMNFEYK